MLFLCSYYGFSQQYPVQVTTTLVPPYSLYLSDYTAIGSNNLQVLVNLLELDRPNLQIKFRITIEGAGITLRTSPAFMPRPLNIQGGVPELFTGADFASYFNPDHMDFSGITRAAFKRSGQLPEGFYTFTLEVLEYNRNVRISNQSVSYAWIVLNDPPLLNTPFNGDKLIATDPQNIMFSWTPRHTASPNAAFSTEYEFRMVELYPGQTNPDIAIRSSNSIYTTTTTLTSLNYGIIEPTLIPGKRYAFRVRAYDTSGRDLFKNDGYSETYVFQYGDACGTFEGIAAKTLDPQRARISWEPDQNHTGCVINYRKNGKEDWFTQEVNGSYGIVAQLAGRTTYEYQLIPQCGTILGEKSPVLTFTTPEVDESGIVCGAPIPEFDASDVPLMKPLLPVDVIQVGDWTVNLLNVTANGDGTYGGAGYAAVPNFNLANVRVVFDRILVNEDYQVVAGDIKTVYSEDSRFVLDIQKKEEEPEVVEGPEGTDTELTEDLVADVLAVEIPADIGEVVFTGGLLEVYDESGNLIEDADLDLPPEGEELTITDSNGDTWVVDGEGVVSGGTFKGQTTDANIKNDTDEIVLNGLSSDLDIVAINRIPTSFKLKDGRLNINYTIKDTLNLAFSKLEFFKLEEEDTILTASYTDIPIGENVDFVDSQDNDSIGWSGKESNGDYVDRGEYLVAITAAIEEDFEAGFEDYQETEIYPFDVSVTDEIDFVGYSSADPSGCFRRAADMLETAGYETVEPNHADVIQMTQVNSENVLEVQDNISDGINLINEHLDEGIPIMVGADYHDGHPGNVDETTDHWLVIVGRNTENGETCFRYYDAQTGHESIGTNEENLLCEEEDRRLTDIYREGSPYERTYTITMVRPSTEIQE
ncbi:MAG: fibronectin type III domain-containing protein [Cyclobacteriaceae bacterium]